MGIAISLRDYLNQTGIDYDVVPHPHSSSSMDTAQQAHIPGDQLAKGVVLADDGGFVMAVVPATHHIEIGRLSKQLNRQLGLVTENELSGLFQDCEAGAIPPIGEAYGLECVVDDALDDCPDVFFEAGDHSDVIRMSGKDFKSLMAGAKHGHFSRHA